MPLSLCLKRSFDSIYLRSITDNRASKIDLEHRSVANCAGSQQLREANLLRLLDPFNGMPSNYGFELQPYNHPTPEVENPFLATMKLGRGLND